MQAQVTSLATAWLEKSKRPPRYGVPKGSAHKHVYGEHPNPKWKETHAACKICGTVTPKWVLKQAGIPLNKSRVRQHTRTYRSGKTGFVKEHEIYEHQMQPSLRPAHRELEKLGFRAMHSRFARDFGCPGKGQHAPRHVEWRHGNHIISPDTQTGSGFYHHLGSINVRTGNVKELVDYLKDVHEFSTKGQKVSPAPTDKKLREKALKIQKLLEKYGK